MLAQIPIDSDLVASLEEVAQQQGESVEDVVAGLVQQYLRQARREKIRQETEWYQKMHTELKKTYLGQQVAIHKRQVVDHDEDITALVQRVRQKYGRIPILITQVHDKPVPEFIIRRPQLLQSE